MKSAATDLASPMTAALEAPYAQRTGTPFTLDATDAMHTIDPPPRPIMPGSTARTTRYIAFAFRSNEKSQAASSQSRMLPWCTYPAQLASTSNGPAASTHSATAAGSSTSTTRVSIPSTDPSPASFSPFTSVASTCAPALAKARATASPIPCAAAVTSARRPASLPCSRTLTGRSSRPGRPR